MTLMTAMKKTVRAMVAAVRLSLLPQEILSALPPKMPEPIPRVRDCDHKECKRYGNAHGRFAKCLTCQAVFKWNQGQGVWEIRAKSHSSSSASVPLPMPSPENTVLPTGTTPKSKPTAKPKHHPSGSSSRSQMRSQAPQQPSTGYEDAWPTEMTPEDQRALAYHIYHNDPFFSWSLAEQRAYLQDPNFRKGDSDREITIHSDLEDLESSYEWDELDG